MNDIAAEIGVSAAFVEKDWFSVQVLKAIADHEDGGYRAIFSGGTSLSKGYGLIERFSEDLDFRCLALGTGSGNQMKVRRRAFRTGLVNAIYDVDQLVLDPGRVAIGSNYVKLELGYPQHHDVNPALRGGLQVEFSFTQPQIDAETRHIQSFVARFSGGEPEVEIPCLSPIETAADKLSALAWRVSKRDRTAADDDPAMIRHLHDIAALNAVIGKQKELFVRTATTSFAGDQQADRRDTQQSLAASVQTMIECLSNDGEYRREYGGFVDAMSYANDGEGLDFDSAVMVLNEIGSWFE